MNFGSFKQNWVVFRPLLALVFVALIIGTLFAEVPVPRNLSAGEAALFRQCMQGNQLVQDFYTHLTMEAEMVWQDPDGGQPFVEQQVYKSNSIDNLRVDRQNDTEQYATKLILNSKRYAEGSRADDKGGWNVEDHSTNREQGTGLITIRRFPCAAFAFWLLPLQSQRFEIQNPASRTEWAITSITKEKQEGLNVIVWKVTDKQQLTGQIVFLEDKQYAIKSYQVIMKGNEQKIDFTCEYEGEEDFRGEKIPLVKSCTYHHVIHPGSSHERVAEHRDWTITSIVPGEVALEEFDPEKVFGVKIVEPQMESTGHFIFRVVLMSLGILMILIWLYLFIRDKRKKR
ncbi:hypothetical protein FACS189419_02430 [Planctomycetales bacterium]|nr:hypothetical protein FACS189419_02430 [Planctomycetales bacterium]